MDHGKAKILVDKLNEDHKNAYENLINVLENNLLAFQDRVFVDYTDHSLKHSFRMTEQLSMMIPDNIQNKMNSLEIFILLCSVWLHDIGMLWNKIKHKNKIEDEKEVRSRHHELSRFYIMEKWGIFIPSLSPAIAEVIANICYCHRKIINIDTVFPDNVIPVANDMVRARLLAAFLRLSDALDTDARRVPLLLLDLQGLDDEISKREWQKHQLIAGIGYDPNKKFAIIINSCGIDNDADKELFLEKCKELYTEFYTVKEILLQHDIHYTSMNLIINEFGHPPLTKDASELFSNPIPSFEALKGAANNASQRIIIEISNTGKYDKDLYFPREDVESRFQEFINSDKSGFALVGPSGMGKTNLFCHLANKYGRENLVLFYNGAYLPTIDIEKQIEKDLSGYCIKQSLDVAPKNRYFILLVDGINDAADSGGLLRYINDLIGRINSRRFKVAFTCRREMWNLLFDYERITLYRTRFFAPEGELEIFLSKFTKGELEKVFQLYMKKFGLSTKLNILSEETKEMLQDPLILRLVCETYKGGIP